MRHYKDQIVSIHKACSTHQQLLTDAQEYVLLEHTLKLSSCGIPPTLSKTVKNYR